MTGSLKFIWEGDDGRTHPELFPGAAQRDAKRNGALQTRDRFKRRGRDGPGSAVRYFAALVPHRVRDKGLTMLEVSKIDLYYGAAQALRGVSLTAEPGKVTCVLGRNGVGKSSLLRALVGQRPVKNGTIMFEGKDITRLSTVERARGGIAYVPQGREIFPLLTVQENLETGFAPLKRANRKVPDDVFTLFPVLKSMLGRRGGDLSGGQQQQLAIGRALTMRPRLLLLDEPTEGIQPSIIKDIGRAISYLRSLGDMAIILVEQYLDFAQELGDHLVVMDRGAIVYQSDKANLDEGALHRAMAI